MSVFGSYKANMDLKREPPRVLLPLLSHVVPNHDGDCRLTNAVVKVLGAREPLPGTTNIRVFKRGKIFLSRNNESANFIESYVVYIDTNEPLNIIEMMAMIGMEGMVPHANLHYTWNFLTPGII